MSTEIISLGYEGRNLDELTQILLSNGVKKLIDVRELPLSRKPGFSKTPLSKHLYESGIEYSHYREAGNPYHREKVDIDTCLSMYSSYLSQHPEIINSLIPEILNMRVAVLCFEKKHQACHRSVLISQVCENILDVCLTKIE